MDTLCMFNADKKIKKIKLKCHCYTGVKSINLNAL